MSIMVNNSNDENEKLQQKEKEVDPNKPHVAKPRIWKDREKTEHEILIYDLFRFFITLGIRYESGGSRILEERTGRKYSADYFYRKMREAQHRINLFYQKDIEMHIDPKIYLIRTETQIQKLEHIIAETDKRILFLIEKVNDPNTTEEQRIRYNFEVNRHKKENREDRRLLDDMQNNRGKAAEFNMTFANNNINFSNNDNRKIIQNINDNIAYANLDRKIEERLKSLNPNEITEKIGIEITDEDIEPFFLNPNHVNNINKKKMVVEETQRGGE